MQKSKFLFSNKKAASSASKIISSKMKWGHKIRLIAVLFICLAAQVLSTGDTGGVTVDNLTCEYLHDPLGIDVRKPRFSWMLHESTPTRGQSQTAYHILVASSKEKLAANVGDLWDSSELKSNQSVLLPYAGQVLKSDQDCYWKVRVADKSEIFSPWSKPARFSMGLLEKKDWEGSWINHPTADVKEHIWFRKRIELNDEVSKAFAYIASIGYHELYVNGKKVDDSVLSPALTRLNKRVLYVTYDITPLLKKGPNVIALWQGPGWSRFGQFRTGPALLVQINLIDKKGQSRNIISDTSWKCERSLSADLGGYRFNDYGGEVIDMTRGNDKWNQINLDDSSWAQARTVTKDVILSAQMVEPDRIIAILSPVRINGVDPCRVDMGKNYTGMLKLNLQAGMGDGDVEILVADDDKGGNKKTGQDFGQRSLLKCSPDGSGVFQNRFNYAAGRYITILGLKRPLNKSDIHAYVVSTDIKRVGQFSCSSDLFNRIYEADLQTFRANTLGGYTMDCPHRERLGYGEVSFATAWGCGLPNYRAGAFYTKFARDWGDVQMKNGYIPHVAPQASLNRWGGPMWSSAPINIAWEVYRQYGDKRILEQVYPTGRRWLTFLQEHVKEGLLTNYTGHRGKFLGDWAAPKHRKEWGYTKEAIFFNNCTYAMILKKFVAMAQILGQQEDAALYGERLSALKKSIHQRFFDREKQVYMSGTQVQQAFVLWLDIVPPDLQSVVYTNLVKDITVTHPFLDMGSSGLPVLLSYLIEDAERNDILFMRLNSTKYPSYGFFLASGENTWPEYWEVNVKSKIHTCYTGIASWFIKGLAGIRDDPAHPGFQKFIIKPYPVGDLTFVKASTESLYGTIVSDWKHAGDEFKLTVEIPPNSTATVYVAAKGGGNVFVGDRPAKDSQGVKFLRLEDGFAIFSVASGRYNFVSR